MSTTMTESLTHRFCWHTRAYIEDTDAGGIVYHANYLNFMERARTECLRQLGFDKQSIFDAACIFVVHSLHIDYKKPALLDDWLTVEAHIMHLKKSSIVFRQHIWREQTLLSEASVKIACIDKIQQKPCAIPEPIYQALQQAKHS